MWLLSTDRAELHYFARNFDAVGGYAILSHTWDREEQSFQDVRAIEQRCKDTGTNPRDDPELSEKIRECCILAEKHGYRWVWIDLCCIDKRSSSELSEAINSMYEWYQASEICFAYLKDVPSNDFANGGMAQFRKSRWHTRGWTLQELIAPDSVIFLSVDWQELGTRATLSLLLCAMTELPIRLLVGDTRPAQYSASTRMSWASQRKTTRVEDEAYCLMGLFGVSMPTNYGEGRRAFIRLQYEIMQHKECDTSLFAFGEVIEADEIPRDGISFDNDKPVDRGNNWQYLLADSPREFSQAFDYIPDLGPNATQQYPPPEGSKATGFFSDVELPRASATSYGVKFRLPVAQVDGVTIAVILCQEKEKNILVGLFLSEDSDGKDPRRPRYFIGCPYRRSQTGRTRLLARMCDLGGDLGNLTFNGKRIQTSWKTIYVVPSAFHCDSASASPPILNINCDPSSPFHLPRWIVHRFTALQFEVDEIIDTKALHAIHFIHRGEGRIFLFFGTCLHHQASPEPPPLWAMVSITTPVDPAELMHDCSTDHIGSDSWDMNSKLFGDDDRRIRLSFMPSTQIPGGRLVIHLEIFGHVFEKMVEESGISFPPAVDLHRNSPLPTPDDAPITSPQSPTISQNESVIAQSTPQPESTTRLCRWFSRIYGLFSLHSVYTICARGGSQEDLIESRQSSGV